MSNLKTALIATASAGALSLTLGISPAAATPLTFTWDPSGASTPLSSQGDITTNGFNIQDFAEIVLPLTPTAPGQTVSGISENGYLIIYPFNGPVSNSANLNNAAGGGGANAYELYFQFSSTSSLTAQNDGSLKGQFDTLNFTLYGDAGGNCAFSFSGDTPTTACGGDTQVALATGTLAPGVNTVSINQGVPSASVTTTFDPTAGQSGFFEDPASYITLDLEAAFTNTTGTTTTDPSPCPSPPGGCTFLIGANGNPGGGNADFIQAPEPLTLAMFGAGLVGIGAMSRRRRTKPKA